MFTQQYQEIIDLYKKMHADGTENEDAQHIFDGKSLKFFFAPIKQIIDLTKSKTLIDFGCGKAKYYFENITVNNNNYKNIIDYWQIDKFFLYDPGVKKFCKYPSEKADGVICVDVVEHIPDEDVYNFLVEIFKLAKKFIFIVIACYPANKKLPDGRNVHLCIKDPDEWKKIITKIKIIYPNISSYVICATDRKDFVTVS